MKMRALKGEGKVGLEEHIKYIKEYRVKAHSMVEPEDIKEKSSRKNDQKKSDGNSSSKSTHAMFKNPKRLDDCRICGTLETMGETDLYVDHISKSVIGFQAMSADERRDVCLKAKICIRCCDKNVIFDLKHNKNCKVNQNYKFDITCSKHPDCKVHSWICSRHKDANKGKISELSKKLRIYPPVNTNLTLCPEPIIAADVHSNNDPPDAGVVPTNMPKPSRARKNMRRYAKKSGNSMFVLAPLKGKTQPVLAFLDSGCSDAVFEHGIPGNQLPGFCINQGPISCTGVGNIQLKARQEWRVQLKMKDGNYQEVQGLTLDDVCLPCPFSTQLLLYRS